MKLQDVMENNLREWGSSDWSSAVQMMDEYLKDQRISPESITDAAEEVADFYYDDMGYESPDDAVNRVINVWMVRKGYSELLGENTEQLNELAPLAIAALHGARLAAPHVARFVARRALPAIGRGIMGTARLAGRGISRVGRFARRHPFVTGAAMNAVSGSGGGSSSSSSNYDVNPDGEDFVAFESTEDDDNNQIRELEQIIERSLVNIITRNNIDFSELDDDEILKEIQSMLMNKENFNELMEAIQ